MRNEEHCLVPLCLRTGRDRWLARRGFDLRRRGRLRRRATDMARSQSGGESPGVTDTSGQPQNRRSVANSAKCHFLAAGYIIRDDRPGSWRIADASFAAPG